MKIKNVLSCLLICTLGISNISYAAENVKEKSGYSFVDKEKDWQQLSSKLDSYGGVWEDFDYEDAVTTVIPGTALMGNGDVGVTSYGKAGEKTYLISKGDFWNAGDMETSAAFIENDKARRALTVGG